MSLTSPVMASHRLRSQRCFHASISGFRRQVGQERGAFKALGTTPEGRYVVVAFTYRDNLLRLLLEQARANITTPVSIRLPVGDLEAAKRVAEKRGIRT